MTQEIKHIPQYPGYAIDNMGNMYSYKKVTIQTETVVIDGKQFHHHIEVPTLMSANVDDKGYRRQMLCIGSKPHKQKFVVVHRLVYQMFANNGEPCDAKLVINHKDGNKINNNIDNLELVSQGLNNEHAKVTGLSCNHSETHCKAKLSDITVDTIRAEYTGKWGEQKLLAQKYGTTVSNIGHILNGKSRKRNPDGTIKTIVEQRSRTTADQRKEIIDYVLIGKRSMSSVAREYKISPQSVHRMVHLYLDETGQVWIK